jgi:hypothetical protein
VDLRERERPQSSMCTDGGETKPLDRCLPTKSCRASHHGRRGVCRNGRRRERYHSTPAIHAAEIERSKGNNRRRNEEQGLHTNGLRSAAK